MYHNLLCRRWGWLTGAATELSLFRRICRSCQRCWSSPSPNSSSSSPLGISRPHNDFYSLEQQSKLYFNTETFEDEVLNGNWDGADGYLSNFFKVGENQHSTKILFEIRKYKYLEALDKHNWTRARDILLNELKDFARVDEEIYKGLAKFLTVDNFRERYLIANCHNTRALREILLVSLRKLQYNPIMQGKLQFPVFNNSRLETLIHQGYRWQHHHCESPKPIEPVITSFLVDHTCPRPASKSARTVGTSDEEPEAGSSNEPAGEPSNAHEQQWSPIRI